MWCSGSKFIVSVKVKAKYQDVVLGREVPKPQYIQYFGEISDFPLEEKQKKSQNIAGEIGIIFGIVAKY